ncbi:type VI secretion system tube protein TssD [Pedobacter hartonius]|uniref:Type VI secretion system needle protein Hcp n=1 Tax=Pedobacter hartonius TaxID=425514 RepID=A0A1H4H9U2_9SPHI|nr:type VI secretion system tube protein TssD [Pedobacter hartonius]SEB17838.1 hypothetical protein SAMN05443550_11425 [Pedobacter hartonius]
MAFKAQLTIAGKNFDIISVGYQFKRSVDPKGMPSSAVYGGVINVGIEANEDTSVIESMVNNQHKAVSGSITIKKQDEDAKMKEIEFTDAYVVGFSETLSAFTAEPMTTRFRLSARKITIGTAIHENDWQEK